MQVYAVQFADGTWGTGTYRRVATSLAGAKLYTKVGPAKAAITYHRWERKGARVAAFDLTPTDLIK